MSCGIWLIPGEPMLMPVSGTVAATGCVADATMAITGWRITAPVVMAQKPPLSSVELDLAAAREVDGS